MAEHVPLNSWQRTLLLHICCLLLAPSAGAIGVPCPACYSGRYTSSSAALLSRTVRHGKTKGLKGRTSRNGVVHHFTRWAAQPFPFAGTTAAPVAFLPLYLRAHFLLCAVRGQRNIACRARSTGVVGVRTVLRLRTFAACTLPLSVVIPWRFAVCCSQLVGL